MAKTIREVTEQFSKDGHTYKDIVAVGIDHPTAAICAKGLMMIIVNAGVKGGDTADEVIGNPAVGAGLMHAAVSTLLTNGVTVDEMIPMFELLLTVYKEVEKDLDNIRAEAALPTYPVPTDPREVAASARVKAEIDRIFKSLDRPGTIQH